MERPSDPILTPVEPTVLAQDGSVLYDPGHDRKDEPRYRPAFSTASRFPRKPLGFLPKLFFGVTFGALLFIGLAAAGVLLGIFLVGLLAKMTFSAKPTRMKR